MSPSVAGPVVRPASAVASWHAAGLRYYKYSHFLRQRFGQRMQRVTVDGGFTCPNADGTLAVGGCVYCDNRSFSPARRLPTASRRLPSSSSITGQIDLGIARLERRYSTARMGYLAYFQPATNTYAPIERLHRVYDEAVAHPRVEGLVIGTRPDCVPDPVLDLIESYRVHSTGNAGTDQGRFVGIELGLQSIHQRSLDWMNRQHDAAAFFDAVERTRGRGIDICAHVILGLPGEDRSDMLATADALARRGIDGIKIHSLHVVKNTPMAEQYAQGQIPLLDRDEYIDVLIEFLERLPPAMVIHRLTGDAPPDFLIAPAWVLEKARFLAMFERELCRRQTWQGRCFESQGTARPLLHQHGDGDPTP